MRFITMFIRIFLVLASALLLCFQTALGQKWEIGAHGGVSGYIGDLQQRYIFPTQSLGFSGGLSGKYNLNQTFGVRANLSYAQLSASDSIFEANTSGSETISFNNNVFEASAVLDFNFYEFRSRRGKTLFTPYVFTGFGYIYHEPHLSPKEISGESLEEVGEKFAPIIPVGAGFKVNLLGPFSVGLQLQYRFEFSDKLDGVAGGQIFESRDPADTILPAISEPNWQFKGSSRPGDTYFSAVVTVSYGLYKWRDPLW